MKTMCGEDCVDACDFCIHYKLNGNELGRYTGDGECSMGNETLHPGDTCDDFHCRHCREVS